MPRLLQSPLNTMCYSRVDLATHSRDSYGFTYRATNFILCFPLLLARRSTILGDPIEAELTQASITDV